MHQRSVSNLFGLLVVFFLVDMNGFSQGQQQQSVCSPYNNNAYNHNMADYECGKYCPYPLFPCCDRLYDPTGYDTTFYCWCCDRPCDNYNGRCYNATPLPSNGKQNSTSTEQAQNSSDIFQRSSSGRQKITEN